MSEIIGYLHVRIVDAIRHPIYKDKNNIPSVFLSKTPITIVMSNKMNYKDYEEERKNPLFPEYIYINDTRVKNINPENGKRII